MPLGAIEKMLHKSMGLHSSTVGSNTVRQAVNLRMRACNIQTLQDYRAIIETSQTELSALIEAVVIPETWFYRDQNPFNALSSWITEHKQEFSAAAPMNILSVPCSSGEEPYTLAMCLADCDVAIGHARIDAVDISQNNVDKALKAEYGNNSFRGSNLLYRSRYFDAVGDRYRLKENIRGRVNFECGNLLDSTFIAGRKKYHVIFCRNLLIYFDRPTQQHAIDCLIQLLNPNGLIFVGHSETSLLRERPFAPIDYPRCFGFRQGAKRTDTADEVEIPWPRRPPPAQRPPPKPKARHVKPFEDTSATQQEAHASAAPDYANRIRSAFKLANEGHLDEAALICETLLKLPEHQADAHYLLGLIREAAGNKEEAEQLFRKAVYLSPDHFEALTHLSAIATRGGDEQKAQLLKARAIRAQKAVNIRQMKR